MAFEASVYELINALSLCVYKNRKHDCNPYVASKLLKSCKIRAYEVLLHKSHQKELLDICDPLQELYFLQFESKLTSIYMQRNRYKDIDQCIDIISKINYFHTEIGKSLILFLLKLSSLMQELELSTQNELKHHDCYLQYPHHNNIMLPVATTETIFSNYCTTYLNKMNTKFANNPYFPSFTKRGNIHNEKHIFDKHFTSPGENLKLVANWAHTNGKLQNETQKTSILLPTNYSEVYKKQIYPCYSNIQSTLEINISKFSWEYLGQTNVSEFLFISESTSSLHLLSLQSKHQNKEFIVKVVSKEQFILDIKSLIVGIQSESFTYDQHNMRFVMESNLTIDNVSQKAINPLVTDFMNSGTCYKRLHIMVTKSDSNLHLKTDGFVYKALCSSVQKYLILFRKFVDNVHDSCLLQLATRTSSLMRQLKALSKLLAVHPDINSNKQIPKGTEFMGFIYREMMEITQKDVIMLYVYILQQCCNIYFKQFEKWIFHGYIDDPCKELFINFVDHYRPNTKFFWDKAYIVKRQSVPGFLQGYEDITLLCGKYTILLKAYKPTHPLLAIVPPKIEVCLSFQQIQNMHNLCSRYIIRAKEVCGNPISVSAILEQKAVKKDAFYRLVATKIQENLETWKAEQKLKEHNIQLQKQKDRIILQQQIVEVREQKIQTRLANLEFERDCLKEAQKAELEQLGRLNLKRQTNIDYYKELSELVDAQRERAEAQIKKLRNEVTLETLCSQYNEIPLENMTINSANSRESEYVTARENIEEDEDELKSVYFSAEKLTDDFEETFSKTEAVLNKLINVSNSASNENDDLTVVNENYKKSELSKRASDYLNSNEIGSAYTNNKAKMLSSNVSFTNKKSVEVVNIAQKPLTDTQKNKFKILHQNNFKNDPIDSTLDTYKKDANFNKVHLTDCAKNKQNILALEFGIYPTGVEHQSEEYVSKLKKIIVTDLPTEMTDLQKNRQKVMHEEFGYKRENPNKLKPSMSLNFNVDQSKNNIQTPMSTGPDTPLFWDKSDEQFESLNAKSGCTRKGGNLLLDTDIANLVSVNRQERSQISPLSHVYQSTPESALNTAGLLAKTGFIFNKINPINEGFNQHLDVTGHENKSLAEINETNLKSTNKYLNLAQHSENALIENHFNIDEMKNLNITTITHFLHMSFIVPMQTYLSVLNNEILRIYLEDLDILGHFVSLRNYFFMMDGEFADYICDGLISKLENKAKPEQLLSFNILHAILDIAIASSINSNNAYSGNLSFIVEEIPDKFDVDSPNVFKMLNLSYLVEWPLNLLLNPETISHYSKIFQHLLKLRRISWVLEKTYQILKDAIKQCGQQLLHSPQYRHVQQVRHTFLSFVNALQNYIISNALQVSWRRFKTDLKTAKSMEDLYQKHIKYLKRIEFLCMLNKSSFDFYIKIEDVFVVILRFYNKLQSRRWRCIDKQYVHPNFNKLLSIEQDFRKLVKYIIHAGTKMSQRGYQTEIGELINVINFNGHYDI